LAILGVGSALLRGLEIAHRSTTPASEFQCVFALIYLEVVPMNAVLDAQDGLLQRAKRAVQKVSELSRPKPREALADVGRNGRCGFTQMRIEPDVAPGSRRVVDQAVHLELEFQCKLIRNQVLDTLCAHDTRLTQGSDRSESAGFGGKSVGTSQILQC
jgi:hypothetical protein